MSLLSPYKSRSSLHFWNDASILILVFNLARFLYCLFSSVFIFLLFDVGSDGAFFGCCCCCCLFSAIVHSGHEISDQVRAGTAPVWGRGTAEYAHEEGGLPAACAQEWLKLLRHSPWLWLYLAGSCQFFKLQPLGGATDSGLLHSWPVSYCTLMIIMTVLANITIK